MSIRGPKGIKLYHNGELCAEMESVKVTVDLLVLNDPKQRSLKRVKNLFEEARKNNTALFGFTFVENQSWKSSRAVMATDVETNEAFVKDSVCEMARVVFGPTDNAGPARICKMCKNGRVYRGLSFNYVSENDGYSKGYGSFADVNRKPVQQLDIVTGDVINEFPSITHAAQHIWGIGLSSCTSVDLLKTAVSNCVNRSNTFPNGKYLGYRWQFTNPQDRLDNN